MTILILGATVFIGSAIATPHEGRGSYGRRPWMQPRPRPAEAGRHMLDPSRPPAHDVRSRWIETIRGQDVIINLVWIQLRLRDLARSAAMAQASLPAARFRLHRVWLAFGFPAFFTVIGILWLVATKPSISLF